MFHTHLYQKEGNNLWCSCGSVKRLPCDHEWQSIDVGSKTYKTTGASHNMETFNCAKCGGHKFVDYVTGECEYQLLTN